MSHSKRLGITKSDLKKYTKQELLSLIDKLVFMADPFQSCGYLQRAVCDIEHERAMKLINEGAQHSKQAYEARVQADELLKPYIGKKYGDVPEQVFDKIAECLKRAEREEVAWKEVQEKIAMSK